MIYSSIQHYTKFLLLASLLLCFNLTVAQDEIKTESQSELEKIDKKKWEKQAQKYDYNRGSVKKQEEDADLESKKELKKNKAPLFSPEVQKISKYSLFGIVILILAFIAFRLIIGGSLWNNKKLEKPKVYTLENLEENLTEVELDEFLNNATKENDYKLIIRLMYLSILKSLSQKGVIQWKKEKSNGDYLKELINSNLYLDFKKCTLIYEFVWFSEMTEFDKKRFDHLQPHFEKLLSEIDYSRSHKAS